MNDAELREHIRAPRTRWNVGRYGSPLGFSAMRAALARAHGTAIGPPPTPQTLTEMLSRLANPGEIDALEALHLLREQARAILRAQTRADMARAMAARPLPIPSRRRLKELGIR